MEQELDKLREQMVLVGKKIRGLECHLAQLVDKAYRLDAKVADMAEWIGCSTRKVRYLMLVGQALREGDLTLEEAVEHGWTKVFKMKELWEKSGIWTFGSEAPTAKNVTILAAPNAEPVVAYNFNMTRTHIALVNSALARFGGIRKGRQMHNKEPALLAMAEFILAMEKKDAA